MSNKLPENYATFYTTFLEGLDEEKDRYRAYDICKVAFKDYVAGKMDDDKMALHLYSFLACWGMATHQQYLIAHNYTCLIEVAQALKENYKEDCPFCNDFCPTKAEGEKEEYIEFVKNTTTAIKKALGEDKKGYKNVLICKLLMVAYGCIMACDSQVQDAWKALGFKWSDNICENDRFLGEYYDYLADNAEELKALPNKTDKGYKFTYSVSKKLDMILWKYGEKEDNEQANN